jgi:rfaE bifunctional protein nucleotidyltransferase chain/domain
MEYKEIINHNIYTDRHAVELSRLIAFWRFKDQKIVFTNGCFDILHRGHIEYLMQAASKGDVLIIGLNSDTSVKRLKGNNRPILNQEGRALTLASLRFVNAVVIFEEETPYELINQINPDVLVKGGDYKKEEIVGSKLVLAHGGSVEIIPFVEGFSTSKIIEQMQHI